MFFADGDYTDYCVVANSLPSPAMPAFDGQSIVLPLSGATGCGSVSKAKPGGTPIQMSGASASPTASRAPRAAIAAHDYGAHLSVCFAARHPERVTRLCLLNSRAHRTFPWPSWLLFAAIGAAARAPLADRLLEHSPLVAIHRLLLAPCVKRGCFDEP